jgi:DUF971 family protein
MGYIIMPAPIAPPLSLHFSRADQQLTLQFDEQTPAAILSYEFLRVHSPSAEVQGHRPEQAVLQTGKKHVTIESVEPVGHYAIRPIFSDGHATGIYTWDYLYHLVTQHDVLWERYLNALASAHASRE